MELKGFYVSIANIFSPKMMHYMRFAPLGQPEKFDEYSSKTIYLNLSCKLFIFHKLLGVC